MLLILICILLFIIAFAVAPDLMAGILCLAFSIAGIGAILFVLALIFASMKG